MSGMDRLTDEALVLIIDQLSRGNHRASLIEDAERAARELLAHRRASQAAPAMTDPTPTRAGYSVHVEDYADMLRSLSAENQALRERAEAAEEQLAEEIRISNERGNHIEFVLLPQMAYLSSQLEKVWNDAIKKAAQIADVKAIKGGKPTSGPHHQGLRDGRKEAAKLVLNLLRENE